MPPKKKVKRGRGVIDKIKSYFFPKNSARKSAEETLKRYGDEVITGIEIRRKPILAWVNKALNLISNGQWDEAVSKAGYDKMFHLSVILSLANGKRLMLEKNEKINLSASWNSHEDAEYMSTGYSGNMTLKELMEKGEKEAGSHSWFQYNAFSNNCQDFVLYVLRAAGANSAEAVRFVKQDTKQLLENMPGYTSKIAQFVTDLGGKASELTGKGKKKRRKTAKKAKAKGKGAKKITSNIKPVFILI